MNEKLNDLNKTELLRQIHVERQALESVLAGISRADMLLPGAVGSWSIKDALAHISTWERWMLAWIASLLKSEAPQVPQPWDIERMNAEAHDQVKDLPLEAVLDEFQASFRDALALVETLSEAQLHRRHENTWPMGPLWLGVAANMNFHYKEHRQDLTAWLTTRT